MRMMLWTLMAALTLSWPLSSVGQDITDEQVQAAIERMTKWLIEQQLPDGSWETSFAARFPNQQRG